MAVKIREAVETRIGPGMFTVRLNDGQEFTMWSAQRSTTVLAVRRLARPAQEEVHQLEGGRTEGEDHARGAAHVRRRRDLRAGERPPPSPNRCCCSTASSARGSIRAFGMLARHRRGRPTTWLIHPLLTERPRSRKRATWPAPTTANLAQHGPQCARGARPLPVPGANRVAADRLDELAPPIATHSDGPAAHPTAAGYSERREKVADFFRKTEEGGLEPPTP